MQPSSTNRKSRPRRKRTNPPRPNLEGSALYKPTFVNLGLAFPPFLQVQHKYVDQFTLTSTLGVMANYRFRATGMFDPNHTATGHQPSYYDVLSEVYDHWIVTRCDIELTIIPTTSAATPTAIGIAQNDDLTTGPTSYTAYEESAKVKVVYFTPEAGRPSRTTMTYRLKDTFPFDSSRGLWGAVGVDPLEETIFNVFAQSVDQTTTAAAFIVAKLTYTAVWFELKDIVTS